MAVSVRMDKAGRVVLPKKVRDELHLAAGDTLDLSIEGERVMLRPRRSAPALQKERGVWVFRTGDPLSAAEADATLGGIRKQRTRNRIGGVG